MMEIRNFVIIAHVDHGKSTLADRFLELTGTVEKRRMREQYLDMHPLERERGITIKMQPVRMIWHPPNHAEFILNLIDTPGHADFSYEVSRALAAVEGAILLVDAAQGVQAQTLANLYLARQAGLVIIPAVNKIDLPSARIEESVQELMELVGCPREDIRLISAKEGTGVEELLRAAAEKIPPPRGSSQLPVTGNQLLRALVFDSKYDPYLGVIAHVRIADGVLRKGEWITCLATGADAEALEVGVFSPERAACESLSAGEIGYVATGIKEPALVRVGDTITSYQLPVTVGLPGYREPEPMVFASLFPENQDDYDALGRALEKLGLEDAALVFTPEDAGVLGRGFRSGFLGLLHMEIVAERVRREYGLSLVLTRPSVAFLYRTALGAQKSAFSAAQLPDAGDIAEITEPWTRLEIITRAKYLGALTTLITAADGVITATESLGGERLTITAEAPLREIVVDFYDKLKNASQGFASFFYSPIGYRTGDLVRLDILIAGEIEPSLAQIVPRDRTHGVARAQIAALKELLPRQLFAVALQAAVDGRIIARETIPALKKDVTGYLYGGDRTRKMKLWKKQQRGKKRLKETGRVVIPPEVFFKLHRQNSNR